MCITAGAVSVPGGNPVTALPGLNPRSPPRTMVGPVLVTVEPARISKLAADPNGIGTWHATLAVVKLQTKLLASALPARSCAPVVMVAVKVVFNARLLVGVNAAILPVASRVTVPVTPGATVKVVVSIVAGFIASLNVAVITVLGHTPAAPLGGATEITVGGGGAAHALAAVVKVHTKLFASLLPDGSLAPVVIVAVYKVLSIRLPAGVKVKILLVASWVTVPVTDVVPGPINVKVAVL